MSNAILLAKLLFAAGLVGLVVVVFGVWYYYGVEISLIIILVVCFALIIGTLIISKRKRTSKSHANIEESHESMLRSNNSDIAHRLVSSVNYISDDSMVLEQSHFTAPQVVNAVVENASMRDSILPNNEVPPSYDEAKTMPTV